VRRGRSGRTLALDPAGAARRDHAPAGPDEGRSGAVQLAIPREHQRYLCGAAGHRRRIDDDEIVLLVAMRR